MPSRRPMIFSATTGYQLGMFIDAARRLGADYRLATDRCCRMEYAWAHRSLSVRFGDTGPSLEQLRAQDFDAVVALGDAPTILAAQAAAEKSIPFHPPAAVRACHNKFLARQLYRTAGLPVPEFFIARVEEGPDTAARAPYPCVLKPLGLSASRGVIRANSPAEFAAAFLRIRALLDLPEIRRAREEQNRYIQVESYIPGREFAIEGLVTGGRLQPLALFDKPDPLEGPHFEETIYVTPSRAGASVQDAILDTVARAVTALGLLHGPVHAEARVNAEGVWMLEAAARPIGGLCAKSLTFNNGTPLEELVLRHAMGEDVAAVHLDGPATGVMMIPIPAAGIYRDVEGAEAAAAVPGITDVIVTAKEGQKLMPLPEGASYLGFLFARGPDAREVEQSLRLAHARLKFRIAPTLATFRPDQAFERGGT